jgi:hypothetical protein
MSTHRILHASDRLYRALLQLYPPRFRARFATEMTQVFRDSCHEAHRKRGGMGVMSRWAETALDLIVSVIDEHSQESFQMARTNLIRVLAMAGLVGGALWVAAVVLLVLGGPGGDYEDSFYELRSLFALGIGLGAAGPFGLYLHTARHWPAQARAMLLLAAAGGLWVFSASFFTTNVWVLLAGVLTQIAGIVVSGVVLWPQPTTRPWATLFFLLAAAMVLFGAAAGIFAIVVSARLLGETLTPHSEPPLAH